MYVYNTHIHTHKHTTYIKCIQVYIEKKKKIMVYFHFHWIWSLMSNTFIDLRWKMGEQTMAHGPHPDHHIRDGSGKTRRMKSWGGGGEGRRGNGREELSTWARGRSCNQDWSGGAERQRDEKELRRCENEKVNKEREEVKENEEQEVKKGQCWMKEGAKTKRLKGPRRMRS